MGAKKAGTALLVVGMIIALVANVVLWSRLLGRHSSCGDSNFNRAALLEEVAPTIENVKVVLEKEIKVLSEEGEFDNLFTLTDGAGIILTGFLPRNLFITADELLHYDYATFADNLYYFLGRLSQASASFYRSNSDDSTSKDASRITAVGAGFSKVVSMVQPLEGATLNLALGTSWLGNLLLDIPMDLYNAMMDTATFTKAFNDCVNLANNAIGVQWSGTYTNATGGSQSWNADGDVDNRLSKISTYCSVIADSSNYDGAIPIVTIETYEAAASNLFSREVREVGRGALNQ
eukprot:CAMPEP_0119122084 /NCGR_PEP_ID=MMETSP1310-20130426/2452_1 /TAXON_ID=464262 /ORGANISM="Genus nov. species nov., Strain RCC2339" /LENGTH=290 /DNA_ID=CAMNT_0007111693 /DNA_START=171 /DNA_END=1043 /DNA_ORIENTATION=+